ncbi:hypothetical protein Pla123a_17060 [Posidoniimonas polymericola]|uniref:Uncharacterized protein n=1 Tax=Posidoniimonas polymericola TaxID=2528002 RepID=A0A5C5YTC8_9BACT|nr:hypothetical protein [Posidoniimonas polymericola]TWT77907.1 hypothetical protein Pla123a_17060 [Posidoniimonas polymericola]
MPTRNLLLPAAVAALALSFLAQDAEAGWGWRRRAFVRPVVVRPVVVAKPVVIVNGVPAGYSGISAGEYQYFKRRDDWYNKAYNGFRPSDFR